MNIALILSGGVGARLNADMPKQYIEIAGRPVIAYCMELFFSSREIDAVQIVAASDWYPMIRKWVQEYDLSEKFRGFSSAGENRQLSILNGLEDIENYADKQDNIVVHDAARPLLTYRQLEQCIRAMEEGTDGVIPVLPVKDTVYLSADGKHITSLIDRSMVYAGQSPEVFVFGKYLAANRCLTSDEMQRIHGSSEPAVMAHMKMAMIDGDEDNFKITTKADMRRFCELVGRDYEDQEDEG